MEYLKKSIDSEMMSKLKASAAAVNAVRLRNCKEVMCDFCGDKNPAVMYASNTLTTGQVVRCWRWTACARCEDLVDAGKFGEIEDHIVEVMKRNLRHIPSSTLRSVAKTALMDFHIHAIKLKEGHEGSGSITS